MSEVKPKIHYQQSLGIFVNTKLALCELYYRSKNNTMYWGVSKVIGVDPVTQKSKFDHANKMVVKLTKEELVKMADFRRLLDINREAQMINQIVENFDKSQYIKDQFPMVSFVHAKSHLNFAVNHYNTPEPTGLMMFIGPNDKSQKDIMFPFNWDQIATLSLMSDEGARILMRNDKSFYQERPVIQQDNTNNEDPFNFGA